MEFVVSTLCILSQALILETMDVRTVNAVALYCSFRQTFHQSSAQLSSMVYLKSCALFAYLATVCI